jgi:hypothetical protein
MSDVSAGETPIEPVPPMPPLPEATAELEAAAPEAAPPEAAAPAETSLPPEADARTLPEIEFAIGPLRQAVLDALLDADEPLSVSRILAEMPPGTSRNSGESAIKREFDAGRIMRTSPGHYALAPARPPGPPQPAPPPEPEPVRSDGMMSERWFAALESWLIDPSTWDLAQLGPPPDQPNHRIPADIAMRFSERLRKRIERQRDREAAAARQAAADAELRDKLIAATGGNIVRSSALDDVSAIRAAMEVVPIDDILQSIRFKTDKKLYPKNEPATSWGEERLLKTIAEHYCRYSIVPSLVAAWSKAGKAPQKPVHRVEASPATQPAPAPENAPEASPPAFYFP